MNRWRISLMGRQGETVDFDCAQGVAIDAAAKVAGFRLRASCKGGGCGICAAQLIGGSVDYVSPISTAKLESCPAGTVFLCRATPKEDCRIKAEWPWAVIEKNPLSRRIATNQQHTRRNQWQLSD